MFGAGTGLGVQTCQRQEARNGLQIESLPQEAEVGCTVEGSVSSQTVDSAFALFPAPVGTRLHWSRLLVTKALRELILSHSRCAVFSR